MSVEPSIGTAATKTIETTIRAVFLDVDGTGADYGVVPEGHVRAVRAAREAGHRVFLCTGRPASMLPESIRGAGFDGLVASAGAYVEIAGEVLVDRRFPADLAARTVAALDRPRPFGELVALELGEGGDDGDHGLSHGPPKFGVRVRGDVVAQRTELDAARLEAVQQLEQVARVPPEPVQLPHHDFVALAEAVQHPVQLRAAGPGPADPAVAVDAFAAGGLEVQDLQ